MALTFKSRDVVVQISITLLPFMLTQSSREVVNLKVPFFYLKVLFTGTNDHHIAFCRTKFDKTLLFSGLLFPDSTVRDSR